MRIGPLGIWELLIILVVVLLIFGPRRLPEMAKGIGQSVREFRKGIRDMKEDFEAGTSKEEKQDEPKSSVSAAEPSVTRASKTAAASGSASPADDPSKTAGATFTEGSEDDDRPVEGKAVETKPA